VNERNEVATLKIAQIKNNTQAAIDALVILNLFIFLLNYKKIELFFENLK
jgi:hypothetical protein